MKNDKTEMIIGATLVAVVILAFVYELVVSMPSATQVSTQAQIIPSVPSGLFSTSSSVNQKIQGLNVPSNLPVAVNPGDVGRSNVFANY